ncbi:MAG: hypothetical protein ABI609_18540 [Acidobacteriota bacterium]
MHRFNAAFGVFVLLSALPRSSSADLRNLSWVEVTTGSPTACLGRVVALYTLEGQVGYPSILATVATNETVAGTCPPTFDVRATDFWEVIEAPDRIGAEYLFFLAAPTATVAGRSVYEMPSRLAWERKLGYSCEGTQLRYYSPSYVNLPDDLRLKQCVARFPSDPDPQQEARIVPETLLFSRLRVPTALP